MTGDLDEFRLVRPLGRGGMGEVYLGHDTILDRAVAIKVISATAPDAVSRERFLTEARAIARLSHPNVVTIYRVGTTPAGRPFLVQELIRGVSLDRLPRPVPWRQVCELAIGIARGLDAAHRRGIIHRDVKPANVMLDEHGTARLLDFGLATLAPAVAPAPPLPPVADASPPTLDALAATDAPTIAPATDAQAALASTVEPDGAPGSTYPLRGTPRYTAPELWLGEPASVRSDLYALGVMLHELVAGRPPYPQTDLFALRAAVLAGELPALEIPDAEPLLALIRRCAARDPAARPDSAAAIAHALEALRAGAAALPDGNPYRGLRAFDAAHRAVFFGRGPDVAAIVDRLRGEPIVVVVGDSGIGKSSVCHAGVVPAVLAGALDDRRTWRALSLAPGRTPWTSLCAALALDPALDAATAIRTLRARGDVLLVLDQLEELVTLSAPGEAAQVAALLGAIAAGVPGLKALVAIRGDFLTRVAALPELGAALSRGLHLLRVLTAGDLREIVVGPARATGVRYESEALIDALVTAVAGDPGALPLLQFTLAELWRARTGEVIPAAALAALGGVEGSLARHADAVLHALPPDGRAAARRIVLRLVTAEATRAACDADELIDGPRAAAALESLVSGRIVVARDTASGAPRYQLAHDALIRSWDTLRGWLDDAAGQHAAHVRLQAATATWQRLGRPAELLWSRRQLAELRDITPTSDERAFLAASRRRARTQLGARIAAFAALPLLALAILTGVRVAAARTRAAEVAARTGRAAFHRAGADVLAARAQLARTAAFARFDAEDAPAGEQLWTDTRRLADDAAARYDEAAAELEAAFLIDASAARAAMARVLWAHLQLADAEHDTRAITELLRRLATYDPVRAAAWRAPAHLRVALPAPARIAIHAARPGGALAGFDPAPLLVRTSATVDADLAPGSYLIVVGDALRDPVLLARGEHRTRDLALPAAPPTGFVYVPPGRFRYGSARDDGFRREFLKAPPLHDVELAGFWISRHETTFAEWVRYLRATGTLAPAGLDGGAQLVAREQQYALVLETAPGQRHALAPGEPLVYAGRRRHARVRWEQLPVVGVAYPDVLAYLAWLDRTGQVRGARTCTVREWQRAATGADGRSFPHGDTLAPGDANFDETYGQLPTAFGPDEVGSFPASDSPFGVADLAGNVWEWVTDPEGGLWFKGGSFYHERISALSANVQHAEPGLRNARTGIRICADLARSR